LWAYHAFGSWRPVFVVTGSLGFIWLLLFRWLYRSPQEHPRLSAAEREDILTNRADASAAAGGNRTDKPLGYRTLLRLPQTWGIIIGKTLTDPIWFFITDWFPIYLVSRGFKLEQSLMAFWVPFLAADIGNFLGGGFSSHLIKRGWSVGAARKLVVVVCGLGMLLLIPAAFTTSYFGLVACFAVSTMAYSAFSTMVILLPADVYPTGSVATVYGMSGTGAGIVTVAASYLTGQVADHYSFMPILVTSGIIPLVAAIAVVTLVRNNQATRAGIVNPI
jgi:ACS family hexuronate transporter-like MFS transporter